MYKTLPVLLSVMLLISCGYQQKEETPPAKQITTPKPTPKPVKSPEFELDNLSNSTIGWGYRPMKNAPPEFTAEQIETMEKFSCIYMGNPDKKYIYLTFDEGYENGYTESILDTLKKTGVKAAFFVTAPYIKDNAKIVRRMIDEGHEVGNHTVHHPSMPSVSTDDAVHEIMDLHNKVLSDFGYEMHFFRPPKGEYSHKTLAIASNLGYRNVFWSLAYLDWDVNRQNGSDYAFHKVTDNTFGGVVILLHAVSKDNAAALYKIITTLQKNGFEFKSLSEYI